MDDLRPSRTSSPSAIEKYASGESSPESGEPRKKPPPIQSSISSKPATPDVATEDEVRHQLDERA